MEKSTTYPSLRRGEILSVECIIACVRCVVVRKAVDGRSGLNLSFFPPKLPCFAQGESCIGSAMEVTYMQIRTQLGSLTILPKWMTLLLQVRFPLDDRRDL